MDDIKHPIPLLVKSVSRVLLLVREIHMKLRPVLVIATVLVLHVLLLVQEIRMKLWLVPGKGLL